MAIIIKEITPWDSMTENITMDLKKANYLMIDLEKIEAFIRGIF